jgi:hypothetical protein
MKNTPQEMKHVEIKRVMEKTDRGPQKSNPYFGYLYFPECPYAGKITEDDRICTLLQWHRLSSRGGLFWCSVACGAHMCPVADTSKMKRCISWFEGILAKFGVKYGR